VNLAGAMATYLLAVWENRQPTVATVISHRLERTDHQKPMGESQAYILHRLRKSSIAGRVAARLTIEDLIQLCREQQGNGIQPQTIKQYVSYLRGAIKNAKLSDEVFRLAIPILTEQGMVGDSKQRLRRPKPSEIERVLNYFRADDRKPKVTLPMTGFIEFAAASGRKVSEITALLWKDLDRTQRTCVSDGKTFRLLGRAWDVVIAQPQTDERIFPYNPHSVSAKFVTATKALHIEDFVLNDLRLEATCRLLENGFGIHDVAEITGQRDHNIVAHIKRTLVDSPRER
jgi:integrase